MYTSVVLKFFANTREGAPPIISRTLLKIAVVSKNYLEAGKNLPKAGEIWVCRILKETHPGVNSGCFIVEPETLLRAQDEDGDGDVTRLYPGSYTTEVLNGRVVVTPKHPGLWMLPLEHKRTLAEQHRAYCVIVDVSTRTTPVPVEAKTANQ